MKTPRPQPPAPTRGFLARNRVAVAAAVVVALVVAAVSTAVYVLHPGGGTTNARSSSAPAHGSLIYDAKLDSASTWSGGSAPSPDPADSVGISYPNGSIDFKIQKPGANLYATFDGPRLKNYVADFVFRADAGSDFGLNWEMIPRGDNETADVYLHIDFAQEAMTLVLSPDGSDNQALIATTPVPHLQSGSTTDIAAVVDGGTITLYLNGNRVGKASETKASGAASPSLDLNGDHGSLHILSLRYYALP
jgi:hypothetical protein